MNPYAYFDMKYQDRLKYLKSTESKDFDILANTEDTLSFVQAWGRRHYLEMFNRSPEDHLAADKFIKERIRVRRIYQ